MASMKKNKLIFAIATGMGLLTDKYELAVTNFVDHLSHFEASEFSHNFVKAAMYGGAIVGMLTFGPLSDYVGRRACLIACSVLCVGGAIISGLAVSETMLILARIITGIGMGGEYPLAATHSAESGDVDDGGQNVALLYLFGSGGGQALCPLIVYILLCSNLPDWAVWRGTFLIGAVFGIIGLVLRVLTTENSERFEKAHQERERRHVSTMQQLRPFALPLLGTAMAWMLYDIIEYGLKQNDAAIFTASSSDYKSGVLVVFFTRLLVMPSLLVAVWAPKRVSIKWVQLIGFLGCAATNLVLALCYPELKQGQMVLFAALYVVQLSFQSLPGVTTMAIPAEIFPSSCKGLAHGISAATGKVGAITGSYVFSWLKEQGNIQGIFTVVTVLSCAAMLLTCVLTPRYNGASLSSMETALNEGDGRLARRILYAGPITAKTMAAETSDGTDRGSKSEEAGPTESE